MSEEDANRVADKALSDGKNPHREAPSAHAQRQTGSGATIVEVDEDEDDGHGVILARNTAISVPQGDRYKVFRQPSQIIIAGATKSGKTTLLIDILKHRNLMFDQPLDEIYWFYTEEHSVADVPAALPRVKLLEGVPTIDKIYSITKKRVPKLVVLDDMQDIIETSDTIKMLREVLNKVSHHRNLSIVFIVQNLYSSRKMVSIRNQCEEICIMCNGTSAMQNAEHLGRALFAKGGAEFLKEALNKAKSHKSHNHLLISTGADAGILNICSAVLPGDPKQTFYVKGGKDTETTSEYNKLKHYGEEGEKQEEARKAGETSEKRYHPVG
jgi:hypothetical protein